MKARIFVIAMALFMLMAGQANAQMPGPTNGRPTESSTFMAPGNPNTSTTVVMPIVPDNDTDTMATPDTDTSTRSLNSITPSSGTAAEKVKPDAEDNNSEHDEADKSAD